MPPKGRSKKGPQPRPEQEAARRNLLDDFNEYGPENSTATSKLQKKVSTKTALREILRSPSPSRAKRASPEKEENPPQGMFTEMCLPQRCACCLFLCNSGAR